jgi:hypothetical protein
LQDYGQDPLTETIQFIILLLLAEVEEEVQVLLVQITQVVAVVLAVCYMEH